MQCFLLKQFQTMMISKEAWRKRPTTKQTAVIRPRLIFQAVFPAVKNHAIQRGSVRTICPRKWPNRTVKGGAEPIMLSIPTCAPPSQVCDSCLLTNSNGDRGSCMCPRQSKSRHQFQHKSPHFCFCTKVGAAHSSSESSSKE